MFNDGQLKYRILLLDGDGGLLSMRRLRLLMEGYEVRQAQNAASALEAVASCPPDVVILDAAAPGVSSEKFLRLIRGDDRFRDIKIIVDSAADIDCGRKSCEELGADACLSRPVDHGRLMATIRKLLHDEMTITFWGTRGSIARPGIDTLKFGGNTPCVSVELAKDRLFVFDAGTGIVDMGRDLARTARRYRFNLLLSHPGWEHLLGLPFFEPLHRAGHQMVIHGPRPERESLRAAVEAQIDRIACSGSAGDYASPLDFRELGEGEHRIDELRVGAIALNHPGRALGYRLRTGRGHSSLSKVLQLACEANARSLYLFNHDPQHDDEAVSNKEALGRIFFEERGLAIRCSAAREGETIRLYKPERASPRTAGLPSGAREPHPAPSSA